MKLNLTILTGLTAASLLSGVFATDAVTDPVGYITTKVYPGTVAAPSETFYGATVVQPVYFAGVVSSVAGTTVNFTALTAPSAPLTGYGSAPLYYVEITNGAGEGVWRDITAFGTNSITTDGDISAMITGGTTTVKIRKHQTPTSLFGANTAGFAPSDSVDAADELTIVDEVLGAVTIFYSNAGGAFNGWRDTSFADASNLVIAPGQGILIKRKATTGVGDGALNVATVGDVKTGKTVIVVQPDENIVAIPLSTGVSLDNSLLSAASITPSDAIESADNVQFQTGADAFTTGFLSNNAPPFAGWRDASFAALGATHLAEGTAIRVLNTAAPNAAFAWTFPAQVIAP